MLSSLISSLKTLSNRENDSSLSNNNNENGNGNSNCLQKDIVQSLTSSTTGKLNHSSLSNLILTKKKDELVNEMTVMNDNEINNLFSLMMISISRLDPLQNQTIDEDQVSNDDLSYFYLMIDAYCLVCLICLEILRSKTTTTAQSTKNDEQNLAAQLSIPESLVDFVLLLNSKIFNLENLYHIEEARGAQSSICKLSEQWWLDNRPEKGALIPQLLPILLIRSLDEAKATEDDINRVYRLRSCLTLIDFDDESAKPLEQLLLRCIVSSKYLHSSEGIKFISQLFLLSEGFTKSMHQSMKMQLSYSSERSMKHLIASFSDIYSRAWKHLSPSNHQSNSSDDSQSNSLSLNPKPNQQLLEVFERHVMQDIIECGLYCANPDLSKAMIRIMNIAFHDNKKKYKGLDSTLCHLYAPYIWKSLSASNAIVRKNAVTLLINAFPITNPEQSIVANDELLQKQLYNLEQSLLDSSPDVRVIAIHGVCRIMSLYWDIIPPRVVNKFLLKFGNDLVHDRSSANVRASVFQGIAYILDNPQSHPAIKILLEELGSHIHDSSQKVRSAFVELLIKVKDVQGLHYYNITQPHDILERLALDADFPSISTKMVKLLRPSFYPTSVAAALSSSIEANSQESERSLQKQQLRRALSLIKRYPKASHSFFKNLIKDCSAGSIAKLIMMLGKWSDTQRQIFYSLIQVTDDSLIPNNASIDDNSSQISDNNSSNQKRVNLELVSHVHDIIVTLWESIDPIVRKKENAVARGEMSKRFNVQHFIIPMLGWDELMEFTSTDCMKVYLNHCTSNYDTILRIAGLSLANQNEELRSEHGRQLIRILLDRVVTTSIDIEEEDDAIGDDQETREIENVFDRSTLGQERALVYSCFRCLISIGCEGTLVEEAMEEIGRFIAGEKKSKSRERQSIPITTSIWIIETLLKMKSLSPARDRMLSYHHSREFPTSLLLERIEMIIGESYKQRNKKRVERNEKEKDDDQVNETALYLMRILNVYQRISIHESAVSIPAIHAASAAAAAGSSNGYSSNSASFGGNAFPPQLLSQTMEWSKDKCNLRAHYWRKLVHDQILLLSDSLLLLPVGLHVPQSLRLATSEQLYSKDIDKVLYFLDMVIDKYLEIGKESSTLTTAMNKLLHQLFVLKFCSESDQDQLNVIHGDSKLQQILWKSRRFNSVVIASLLCRSDQLATFLLDKILLPMIPEHRHRNQEGMEGEYAARSASSKDQDISIYSITLDQIMQSPGSIRALLFAIADLGELYSNMYKQSRDVEDNENDNNNNDDDGEMERNRRIKESLNKLQMIDSIFQTIERDYQRSTKNKDIQRLIEEVHVDLEKNKM